MLALLIIYMGTWQVNLPEQSSSPIDGKSTTGLTLIVANTASNTGSFGESNDGPPSVVLGYALRVTAHFLVLVFGLSYLDSS